VNISTEERFFRHVCPEPNTGCWLWMGSGGQRTASGLLPYGSFWFRKRQYRAHRAAYEMFNGPIPPGMTIDHLCRVSMCVNPRHLEAVTLKENILRGDSACARHARTTHCTNGHELTGWNLIVRPEGGRQCRECGYAYRRSERGRAWRRQFDRKRRGSKLYTTAIQAAMEAR